MNVVNLTTSLEDKIIALRNDISTMLQEYARTLPHNQQIAPFSASPFYSLETSSLQAVFRAGSRALDPDNQISQLQSKLTSLRDNPSQWRIIKLKRDKMLHPTDFIQQRIDRDALKSTLNHSSFHPINSDFQ